MSLPVIAPMALPANADDATLTAITAIDAKKKELGALLIDLEDQTAKARRDLAALTAALAVFGVTEPEEPQLPAKVKRRRTKEGFRRGELSRRVLEKIRDAGKPVAPSEIGRAIMRDCLMDVGDQKLYFAFQHKIHNVVRRQWQKGVLERVGGDDGYGSLWKIAEI